jgi:hypothetical protein
MNKYLMLSAAALLGTSAPAFAADPPGTHRIHFYNNNGGSYCDGMSFFKSPYQAAPIILGAHLQSGCGEADDEVAGKQSKTTVTLVADWISQTGLLWTISRPIQTGGTWTAWACPQGSTCFEVNSGVYHLGYEAGRGHSVATTARVAEMIAKRKAAAR